MGGHFVRGKLGKARMSLYSLKAQLVITNTERIAAKYYSKDWPTLDAQRKFENKIVAQRSLNSTDGVIIDDVLVLYKVSAGTFFCVVGSMEENPYILSAALDCLFQATSNLLRGQVDRRTLLENLDYLILVMDEVIDKGILMETDAEAIADRVSAEAEVPLAEQTFAQAFQSGRSMLDSLLK